GQNAATRSPTTCTHSMDRCILRYHRSTPLALRTMDFEVSDSDDRHYHRRRRTVQAASRGTLWGFTPWTCASRRGSRSQISRLILVISCFVRTISCRRLSSSAFISPNLRLDLVSINRIDWVWVMAPVESKMNMQGFNSLR